MARYDDEQVEAVTRVLRSGKVNYWTGIEGREFEREFAEYVGLEHAVFVANGTLALELAIQALDLPAGAEVITTPRTYIASSSSIVRSGLRPVFVDVDPTSNGDCVQCAPFDLGGRHRWSATSRSASLYPGGPTPLIGHRAALTGTHRLDFVDVLHGDHRFRPQKFPQCVLNLGVPIGVADR